MNRATTSRYASHFHLFALLGLLWAGTPLGHAQTVPLDDFTCRATDDTQGGASGIAFADSVRAIAVLVRFKDDDWGDCGEWWCEMLEWPQCENHYDPQCSVVPKSELPDWGTTLLHPDETDFPASPISLPSSSPIADSSLSAFFWEQSRTGSGEAHRLWGDVLPQDANGDPYVYVTQDSTKYYYNPLGGFGDLTTEILAHLDSTGVDFSEYDANHDGYVDHIFLIVRRALYRDENGEWQGHPGGTGWAALNGYGISSGGFSSATYDGVTISSSRSGSTNHMSGRGWRLLVHEYLHRYFDMGHTKIIENNDVPLVVPPPGEKGHAACAYNIMCGTNASSDKSNYNSTGGALSGWERRRAGWIAPDVIDATTAPDASGLTVGDFYLTGDTYYFPLKTGSAGDTLVLENRQRRGYFNQRTYDYSSNPNYDVIISGGLKTTGLLATLSKGDPSASASASGYFYDPILADNEFEHVSECIGEADNCFGLGLYDGDLYSSETKRQLSPWTRPNVSGYTYYPTGFEPNWFAIDDIRYVSGDPDSTMAFDYYADFRTAPVVTIRDDSWMGAETDGTTFPNEVRVTDGATLTIKKNTELAFDGGLTVEKGAHVVFETGSVARFGDGEVFTVEGMISGPGAGAAPVVFEGHNLTSGQHWGGLKLKEDSISLSYVEVADATTGIEVLARGVTLDHVTLQGNVSGLATDYRPCPNRCTDPRSSFSLTNSTVSGNSSHGLLLRNTEAEGSGVAQTTIENNDGHGVVVWNADVLRFEGNTVEGNGLSGDGIAVLAGGDLRLSSLSFDGYNRIADNTDDELSVASGGYLFVGSYGSGQNTIMKSTGAGVAPDTARLIETDVTVYARYTFWGDASGPPSNAFGGSGTVYYTPYLTSAPAQSFRSRDTTPHLASAISNDGSGKAGANARGEGDDLEWLREQVLHFRSLLTDGPLAPGLVRRLYALQRIDRDDVLGEREATMTLLAGIRSLLDDPVGGAAQRAAEAALGAEVSEALSHDDYEAAGALLEAYSVAAAESEDRGLALGVVAVDEEARRYAAALDRLQAVIASLDEDEAALAQSLSDIAAAITSKLDGEARNASAASRTDNARSGVGATLPAEYALHAAYPNPTATRATVPFALPATAEVRIEVYDVLGRRVDVLADGRYEAGRHRVTLDASGLGSGTYVVRAQMVLEHGGVRMFTQKLTLVR